MFNHWSTYLPASSRRPEGSVPPQPVNKTLTSRDVDRSMAEAVRLQDVKGMKEKKAAASDAPRPLNVYDSPIEGWPDYYKEVASLAQLPNTYIGAFAAGAYAPLKLTRVSSKWRSTRHVFSYAGTQDLVAFGADPTLLQANMTTTTASYPYVMAGYSESDPGNAVVPRCDVNVIHIAIRGMSKDASFKLVIRAGFELEPSPGSNICTFMRVPPEEDSSALVAYGRIVRQLKDCYPEAYNSWEKLVDVIETASKAANVVLPGAGLVGDAARWLYNTFKGPGKKANTQRAPAASSGGGGASSKKGGGDITSQASKETLDKVISQQLAKYFQRQKPLPALPPSGGKGKKKRSRKKKGSRAGAIELG